MAADPESPAKLKKIVERTPKIAKVHKEVKAAFAPNEAKLRAAIKDGKRNLIETYKAVNQAQIEKISGVIGDINGALVWLSELNQDSEFVEPRVAQIEKLAEIIDNAQSELTDIFQKAKRLENDAEKGVTAAIAGSRMELRDLAQLGDSVKTHTAEAKAAFTLKALGLDKKFEQKLKKALEGPPAALVKALDTIAGEAKLEGKNGKTMRAELVKQKVIAE